MKKRKDIIFVISYVLLITILSIFSTGSNNSDITRILNQIIYILISLFILIVIVAYIYIYKEIRYLNKQADKMIIEKDYDSGIQLLENKIKEYWIGLLIIHAKLLLLITYLTAGKNELAKDILNETKWGDYLSNVLYIKILFALYDGDISKDKTLNKKLSKIKNKKYRKQQERMNYLIKFVDDGIPDENIYQISMYPITKEIYLKYEK